MCIINKTKVAPVVSEFLGTGLLVAVAIVLTETTAVSYFVATSLALALAAIVMIFGGVSGAHVNPAITFGMWVARKIGTLRAISYIAAQMLGGVAAWQLVQYLVNKPLMAKNPTFSTRVWLAEAVGTMVLAMGFMAAINRGFDALQSALVMGASIFAGIMIAAVASVGYINPAIALGARSWGTAYVLGPLVGGMVGCVVYNYLFGAAASKKR